MKNLLTQTSDFLKARFSMRRDQEREDLIIEDIRKEVEFRGAKVWILVFAIMIASVGLNVNATAVVIGAMLISPLMGPIMGIGLGVGISDLDLLKKASINLAVMVAISVITSTIYFSLSPLQEDNSELLGRTSPTIWDVFIALFGGLAGIMATATKEEGNVIPGVAIATALMPPLCTAGYGIAIGSLKYFAGAFYLFSINTVFIFFSTMIVVRFLRFHEVNFLSPESRRRVQLLIGVFVVAMIIPSIYIAQNLVRETLFKQKAESYVNTAFHFPATHILHYEIKMKGKMQEIKVTLFGEPLDTNTVANLKNQLPAYGLERAQLSILQDKKELSPEDIRTEVMQNFLSLNLDSLRSKDEKINYLSRELVSLQGQALPMPQLSREAAQFAPRIQKLCILPAVFYDQTGNPTDTIHLAMTTFDKKPAAQEISRFEGWLKVRLESDSVRVVLE